MAGVFLHSLVMTDVCTGWTEALPLLAREQSLVAEGLERLRGQLPIPILGLDSDNDSAFMNETLVSYCEERHIEFTRSRAYRKNDQAWIVRLTTTWCGGRTESAVVARHNFNGSPLAEAQNSPFHPSDSHTAKERAWATDRDDDSLPFDANLIYDLTHGLAGRVRVGVDEPGLAKHVELARLEDKMVLAAGAAAVALVARNIGVHACGGNR